jgi:putative flavoprotein involved in K+ transport
MNGASFSGKKIIVVGGGNSAVQIAVELAEIADVTITTRSAIKYVPQRILGKDIHFWINLFRLDQSTLGKRLLMNSSSGVLDTGTYRNAIANNKPTHKEMFRQFTETGIIWEDGTHKEIDAVIFATGFVPNYGFLQNLDVLDEKGSPRQQRGISMDSKNLYFVGLPWQNSFASATIRGSGKDAKIVVNDLFKYLKR